MLRLVARALLELLDAHGFPMTPKCVHHSRHTTQYRLHTLGRSYSKLDFLNCSQPHGLARRPRIRVGVTVDEVPESCWGSRTRSRGPQLVRSISPAWNVPAPAGCWDQHLHNCLWGGVAHAGSNPNNISLFFRNIWNFSKFWNFLEFV